MSHRTPTYLMLSLIFGAAQLAGCLEAEENRPEEASSIGVPEAPAPGLTCTGELDPETSCPDRQSDSQLAPSQNPLPFSSYDLYFHPNNGSHGGWIEAWRLCNQGGNNYVICAGGYAPVRYWNPSSCGGTIQDYYPQGWHGWAQTGGGCG